MGGGEEEEGRCEEELCASHLPKIPLPFLSASNFNIQKGSIGFPIPMAAPPRGTFSSRAFSAAYMVATAAPPRVRFAALYLLLGALWLANASTIAKAFERCLGVDCFILDRECRLSLAFPVIGVMSLFLLRGHWRRLSEAREDAVGAHVDLPPEGPSQEPGRACPPVGNMGHRNDLDMHLAVCVFAAWAMLGLQGMMYRLFSPEMGSPLALLGSILAKLGCLGAAYVGCLLVIPCIMLRLRVLHMDRVDKGATAA
ncbi:hypothetical protein ACQ4PT_030256 [Festuca glaucescens]